MSIYEDLNDVKVDISEYEEQRLTSFQKKHWENRVLKKIRKHKTNYKRKYVGAAAAFIIAIGLSLSTGMLTFADVPFVGALIEGFIATNEKTDYSLYKTEIGSTAENEYGKWTLNEVMLDSGHLIISSTFEPSEGVKFHYKMHPRPKILINGEISASGGLQQSIKINQSMYTIYNKIKMPELQLGETVQFHIEFDNLDSSIASEGVPVDRPWVFDIKVPTEQLAAVLETIHLNQEIPLGNGHFIRLNKLVVSPISTILYYDWPEEANHIAFKIVSESGTEMLPGTATISTEGSTNEYSSIDLKSEKYYLVPFESSDNPHAKNPGKIDEQQAILINP